MKACRRQVKIFKKIFPSEMMYISPENIRITHENKLDIDYFLSHFNRHMHYLGPSSKCLYCQFTKKYPQPIPNSDYYVDCLIEFIFEKNSRKVI